LPLAVHAPHDKERQLRKKLAVLIRHEVADRNLPHARHSRADA
jgi:hypothetical protein